MALIKCEECGQMVSDKAAACPHCGCPVTVNNQTTVNSNDLSNSTDEDNGRKKHNSMRYLLVIGALAFACLVGGYFYLQMAKVINDTSSPEVVGGDIPAGKYCIILHNDNLGELIAPNGGHICGLELYKEDPLSLRMTKKLTILGHNTELLYISGEYLFADYSDYLDLQYGGDLNCAALKLESQNNDLTIYSITFSEGQFDYQEAQAHNIDYPEDQYTAVYYKEGTGSFYGPGKKYICGLKKMVHKGNFCFTKTITIYDEPFDDLYVLENKVWKSNYDPITDRYAEQGKESLSLADATYIEEGDMILAHFPIVTKLPRYVSGSSNNSNSNSSSASEVSSSSSSQWQITSVDQLKGRLDGTIWTCRPAGHQWYRLVFSHGNVTLYYASPSLGRWAGGDESHVYKCEIKEGHSSYDGEKYIAAALVKDDHTWGGLMFFKNGDVEFTWLNGREGGPAECKDYNWE